MKHHRAQKASRPNEIETPSAENKEAIDFAIDIPF